jgi:hypothetical protein
MDGLKTKATTIRGDDKYNTAMTTPPPDDQIIDTGIDLI